MRTVFAFVLMVGLTFGLEMPVQTNSEGAARYIYGLVNDKERDEEIINLVKVGGFVKIEDVNMDKRMIGIAALEAKYGEEFTIFSGVSKRSVAAIVSFLANGEVHRYHIAVYSDEEIKVILLRLQAKRQR
jgi:hypothetical protein